MNPADAPTPVPASVPKPPVPMPPVPMPPLALAVVIVSLALNVALGLWLRQSLSAQNRRLARLETRLDGGGKRARGNTAAATGRTPRQATRQDRIAFLLAAAGNPDQSKQILSVIPPEEIVEMVRALIARPAANDRNEALDAALRYLAANNPARALALLPGVEESGLKSRLARHILTVWTATAPDAAARWLSEDGGQFFDTRQIADQLTGALSRWSAFAPEAAARFIDARPPDGDLQPTPTSLSLGQASLEWARQNTTAALAWVQSLPPTDPRQPYALDGVIQAWTEQDPAAAAGFVRQTLLTARAPGAAGLAVVVVQAWAGKDVEAAARWAQTLPETAARGLAMREAAARWSQTDPMSAARWAAGLPADRARGAVWVGLTERLADADSARAETWLTGLPAGRNRDEATAVYINRLAPTDPERALVWARTLTGPGFAENQVGNVLEQWEVKDGAAARNWAAANGIALPPVQTQGGR